MQKAAAKQARHSQGEQRLKTRDRILQTARELFNEQGEANVTLAQIGERLGISEGNVWYHFHTKHDLIFALFAELQVQVKANQQGDLGDLRQIRDLQVRGFHLMWEYRFLFRDHINWAVAQREVHEQLVALTVRGHAFIEQVLERLCQLELLHIQKSEIAMLATNIWVISRYWIDYCQTRSDQQQITEQDVQEGIQQVRALVFPYLTPGGRHMLSRPDQMTASE
jgi:AcrR family transcriptional regulator